MLQLRFPGPLEGPVPCSSSSRLQSVCYCEQEVQSSAETSSLCSWWDPSESASAGVSSLTPPEYFSFALSSSSTLILSPSCLSIPGDEGVSGPFNSCAGSNSMIPCSCTYSLWKSCRLVRSLGPRHDSRKVAGGSTMVDYDGQATQTGHFAGILALLWTGC